MTEFFKPGLCTALLVFQLLCCLRDSEGQLIVKINETKPMSPCTLPQQPLNGKFRIRRQGGVAAIFTCNNGYDLNGTNTSFCVTETRLWTSLPPTCIPALTKPDQSSCNSILFEPQVIVIENGNLVLNCLADHRSKRLMWLRNSVALSYVVPGISLMENGSLSLSSKALNGIYVCLELNDNSVRVAATYNVTAENDTKEITDKVDSIANDRVKAAINTYVPIYHNVQSCGITPPFTHSAGKRRKKRIIDGTRAEIGSSPWMGMIATDKNSVVCGCSLLNRHWVITAAHCFNSIEETDQSKLVIKLGKYLRRQREPGQFASQVSKIVVHPQFRSRVLKDGKVVINTNDIAMMRLETPVPEFLLTIIPICLPKQGLVTSLPLSTLVVVTGWGRVSVQQSISAYTLQEAKLPLVDRATCERSSDYSLAEGTLCAGYAESYKPDTCDGDSGGPLVATVGDVAYLIGIVSWGQGCSSPGKYGIYTDVEKYLPWISTVLNERIN